jgi:DNA invertase Pin-like site-specific DNA recombinase
MLNRHDCLHRAGRRGQTKDQGRLDTQARVALKIEQDYATRNGWGIVFGDLDIDTSTAAGKTQLSMFATVAKFERDRISERTREALAVKRSEGVRLGRPSALPDELLSRMYAEQAAGASLREIADGLTRDGIATAQGGHSWHASTVSKALTGQDGKISRAATVLSTTEGAICTEYGKRGGTSPSRGCRRGWCLAVYRR